VRLVVASRLAAPPRSPKPEPAYGSVGEEELNLFERLVDPAEFGVAG
jgi:hypothetical protein